jgi:hypothetical protein
MPRRSWTPSDDNILRKYYDKKPKSEVARSLGRSIGSVTARAGDLHLRRKLHLWAPREIIFLRRFYPTKGGAYIARELNRPLSSVQNKTHNLRIYLKDYAPWSKKEEEYIRQWYGKRRASDIAKKLRRTTQSVVNRAWFLGLTRYYRRWSDKEIEYTLDNYPHTTKRKIAKALGRTIPSVAGLIVRLKKHKFFVHKYTANEKRLIRRFYTRITVKELATRLHLSEQRLRATAHRMRLSPRGKAAPRYTQDERSFIFKNYQSMTYRQLAGKLGRPLSGVIDYARRFGLKKT